MPRGAPYHSPKIAPASAAGPARRSPSIVAGTAAGMRTARSSTARDAPWARTTSSPPGGVLDQPDVGRHEHREQRGDGGQPDRSPAAAEHDQQDRPDHDPRRGVAERGEPRDDPTGGRDDRGDHRGGDADHAADEQPSRGRAGRGPQCAQVDLAGAIVAERSDRLERGHHHAPGPPGAPSDGPHGEQEQRAEQGEHHPARVAPARPGRRHEASGRAATAATRSPRMRRISTRHPIGPGVHLALQVERDRLVDETLDERLVLGGDGELEAARVVGARAAVGDVVAEVVAVQPGRGGVDRLVEEQDRQHHVLGAVVDAQAHRERGGVDVGVGVLVGDGVVAAAGGADVTGHVAVLDHAAEAVAHHLVRSDRRGPGVSERGRVQVREVGEVEEVVGHLGGAGVPVERRQGHDGERRIVPLGHVDQTGDRRVDRDPHQPVALGDGAGGGQSGARAAGGRRRRATAPRRTGRRRRSGTRGRRIAALRRTPSRRSTGPCGAGSGRRTPPAGRRCERSPTPRRAGGPPRPCRRRRRCSRTPGASRRAARGGRCRGGRGRAGRPSDNCTLSLRAHASERAAMIGRSNRCWTPA